MKQVSLVIPCFNESTSLPELFDRLEDQLPVLASQSQVQFTLIFVDDGSDDQTVTLLSEAELSFSYELVCLSRNFGKEAALSAGLDFAKGDAVILMDADLQHPIERISEMLALWNQGYEVVYTYKRDREQEGRFSQLFSRLFYAVVNYGSRVEMPENAGDFRLLDRKAVDAICALPENQRFMKGLYAWVGFKQKGIAIDIAERAGDAPSRFGSVRLAALAIDGITSFSIAPIRMMSLIGVGVALLSMVYLAWIVLERIFFETPFSGFSSIAGLISLFGGLQLFTIGLIGEYISKTLLEAKKRPSYIVSRHLTFGSEPKADV